MVVEDCDHSRAWKATRQSLDNDVAAPQHTQRLLTGDALQRQRERALAEGGVKLTVLLKLAAQRGTGGCVVCGMVVR